MPSRPSSPKVHADIAKNRLMLQFTGRITKKQLDSLYTDIRFCVADLKPGFHVISDLSACTIGSLDCLPTFRKIMTFLIEKQVGEVIRVTKRQSIIHRQIINFSARRQGYKPVYVSTIDEAEQYLENTGPATKTTIELLNLDVHYSSAGNEGKGTLLELSTDCCSIKDGEPAPGGDEEIQLNFTLHSSSENTENFSVKARIISMDADTFTCEFADLDESQTKLLWKCLVFEANREV